MSAPAPPTPGTPNQPQFLLCSPNWTISAPQNIIYGLDHLAGLTVTGLADGVVIAPTVVSATGTLTLPFDASLVTIGLGFTVQVQTPYLDTGNPTVQGRRKDILAVTVRVDSSAAPYTGSDQPDGGAQTPVAINPPWTGMVPAVTQNPNLQPQGYFTPGGQIAYKLFSGDFRANIPANWDTRGQTAVQQTAPQPLSVVAVVPEALEGDTVEQGYAPRQGGGDQGQRGPGLWMLR